MHSITFNRRRPCALAPAAALLLALCLLAVGVQAMTGPMDTTAPVTGAVFATSAAADPGSPAIDWQKSLGGSKYEQANAMQQTADGGYIAAGETNSNNGDVSGNHGGGEIVLDVWVVKLDAAGGLVWQKCLGGTGNDGAKAVQQTDDGGYIVAGYTTSTDGDVTGNHGTGGSYPTADAWVVKLNATGALVWQRCLGGTASDGAAAVRQTVDGGYIVAGSTASTDGDAAGNHGSADAWVVKLDAAGAPVWQKCLGGTMDEVANAVQQAADGGYILAAWTQSTDGDVTGNHGSTDAWMVKLNATGGLVWQRCLGGTGSDEADAVQQTADGGYIVAGETRSTDGDVTGNHGSSDAWVVKLNPAGGLAWEKCLGGSNTDIAHAIRLTADGGYIVGGETGSTDGDVTGNHGYYDGILDLWVLRLDPAGGLLWQKCLGGTDFDRGFAVQQTSDGRYVVAGITGSTDGDVTGNHGWSDLWVAKLDSVPVPPPTKPPVNDTHATGYETPLVVRDADQLEPALHDTRIVWRDTRYDDFQGDIYSYDLASHIEQPEIASRSDYGKFTTSDYDAVVSSAGIFGVWSGRSDADVNNEIYGRTLAGDPVNVTLLGQPGQRYISDLAIDGNWLVYVLSSGGDSHTLIKYDTASGAYWEVRTAANEIRSPDIFGDATVVWQEYDGNDWNVWAEIPGHGSTVALANDPGDQVTPTVSGTRVVWADKRSGNWDLYTADLSQPNPVGTPWLVAPGDQTNPHLSGDRVVWQDNRNGDWDIYTGSLSSGAVATVCTAADDQVSPAIDGDRIVWQDKRNGNWDLYMFTLSATGPMPVPTPAPLVITSPGTYSVVADGHDGNATPIEIRSSNVVLDGGNHTIDGSGRAGSCGILVGGAGTLSNVVVKNVRLTNWETGIRADGITGSVIEASTISHNQEGIVLDGTRDVQVWNSTVTANDVTGIVVRDSRNTTVRGNDVRRTGDGIEIHLQTLMDLSTFAIQITRSTGTVVSGNDLGGAYGSLDLGPSNATRVTGNQLTGGYVGILSLQQGEGAAIYNNVINDRTGLYGTVSNATWNVTPSPGPNIVGGPQIGGNFWTNLDGTGFSETHPDANHDGFCDASFDVGGGTDFLPLAVWNGSVPGPTPYKPLSVPGRIQAEDYDLGGEGVAYHDTTAGNSGGAYRHDDVDIETSGGVTNVGWVRNGEYLTYTANVTKAGTHTMTARVASPNTGRTIALLVDGAPAATIAVPNTGSFATFRDVGVPVTLAAGTHVFRLTFAGDGQNLDWFEFAPISTPPPQPNGTPYTPLAIPGTIQAENYNLGGEGVAYHDSTPGNTGGAYRHDDVDIETAGGITNVGWIRNGEFLTYTANVTAPGQYTMSARVASPNSGRTIAVTVDGAAAGTISVPNTGSFATFRTVEVPVTLAAGSHTLKLAFSGDGQNLDWIAFGTTTVTTPPTTPAAGGASFVAVPATAAHGSAVKFTVTPASGKSIGSVLWSFDAPAHLNTWNSRATNPTFFYPSAGIFSPQVKITYTDGSTETVQRASYVRAT